MASFPNTTLAPITYDGTVSSGIKLALTLTRDIPGFVARMQAAGEIPKVFTYDGQLKKQDIIFLSTVPGDKYIQRMRGTEIESILAGVSPFSDWLALQPGGNSFGLQINGSPNQMFTLGFATRFGGL